MKPAKLFPIIILILMLGCQSASTSPTNNINPPIPETHTATPSNIPSKAPSPIAISSWTPLPTLISDEADLAFKNWLRGTSTCLLPCWAGIMPGETSWDEAIHIVAPALQLHIAEKLAVCRYGPCRYLAWQHEIDGQLYDGNIFSKDDVVYAVSLNGDIPHEYALREIFVKYGQPDQVFVYTNPYTYVNEPLQLDLVIFYEKFKFAARYIWQAEVQDENIVACGTASGFILGIVAHDESPWTKSEIAKAGTQLDNGSSDDRGLHSIADATGANIDLFYQKALEETDSSFCIRTPRAYWK